MYTQTYQTSHILMLAPAASNLTHLRAIHLTTAKLSKKIILSTFFTVWYKQNASPVYRPTFVL